MWSMDDWKYVEKQTVTDPKSRRWTVALMDVLGLELLARAAAVRLDDASNRGVGRELPGVHVHPERAQRVRHQGSASRPEFDQVDARRTSHGRPDDGAPQADQFDEHLADLGRGHEIRQDRRQGGRPYYRGRNGHARGAPQRSQLIGRS